MAVMYTHAAADYEAELEREARALGVTRGELIWLRAIATDLVWVARAIHAGDMFTAGEQCGELAFRIRGLHPSHARRARQALAALRMIARYKYALCPDGCWWRHLPHSDAILG